MSIEKINEILNLEGFEPKGVNFLAESIISNSNNLQFIYAGWKVVLMPGYEYYIIYQSTGNTWLHHGNRHLYKNNLFEFYRATIHKVVLYTDIEKIPASEWDKPIYEPESCTVFTSWDELFSCTLTNLDWCFATKIQGAIAPLDIIPRLEDDFMPEFDFEQFCKDEEPVLNEINAFLEAKRQYFNAKYNKWIQDDSKIILKP